MSRAPRDRQVALPRLLAMTRFSSLRGMRCRSNREALADRSQRDRHADSDRDDSITQRLAGASSALVLAGVLASQLVAAQMSTPQGSGVSQPARVERLGPDSLRVGNVRIDTAKKEIAVKGVVLDAQALEFVAVTKGGRKAYEAVLELDTNAFDFNLGLILVGLDQSRSVLPKMHLDPAIPKGDPVEIWVEWDQRGARRKVRAEQLIYNKQSNATLPEGPWVYTGSLFSDTGGYMAEVQGTLIGFVHTPTTIIDSPRPLSAGPYGTAVLNPALDLKPGTSVELTVRALPRGK